MKRFCIALLALSSAFAFSALANKASEVQNLSTVTSQFLLADNDQDQSAGATSNGNQQTDQDSNGSTDQNGDQSDQSTDQSNDQSDDQMGGDEDND